MTFTQHNLPFGSIGAASADLISSAHIHHNKIWVKHAHDVGKLCSRGGLLIPESGGVVIIGTAATGCIINLCVVVSCNFARKKLAKTLTHRPWCHGIQQSA